MVYKIIKHKKIIVYLYSYIMIKLTTAKRHFEFRLSFLENGARETGKKLHNHQVIFTVYTLMDCSPSPTSARKIVAG